MKKMFTIALVLSLFLASCARTDYPQPSFENRPAVHNVNNIFN